MTAGRNTRRIVHLLFAAAACAVPSGVAVAPAAADHARGGDQRALATHTAQASDPDVTVTARPDTGGYRLFTARAAEGWAWRPLATIQPQGNSAEPWIGYHCVTGDKRHVVAVVAPRRFANVPKLRDRGALAYVVDVRTGRVRPLIKGVALKYHSPGCGAGSSAVLSRSLLSDQRRTELLVVDARRARITRRVQSADRTRARPPPAPAWWASRAPPSSASAAAAARARSLASQAGRTCCAPAAAGSICWSPMPATTSASSASRPGASSASARASSAGSASSPAPAAAT